MLRSCAILSFGVVVMLFASPAALWAQSPAPATVSGTGSVEIKRQPETLRVQIELMARGKTLKEALDKLKARREEAQATLIQLGARKDGIILGDATTADDLAGRQGDVDRMMRDRNRALNKPPGKVETASIVSGVIRVDFPLPARGADEFLLASRGLQEKIKSADLGGLKDKGKLTPEEQEAIEEAVGRPRRGDEGEVRGDPLFFYVSKISEEERSKALAEAFAKAKRDAERLARAAGAELGALHRITNPYSGGGDLDDPYALSRRGYYGQSQLARPLDGTDDESAEAVGLQPGKVSLRLGVVAEFTMRAPTGK